MDEKLEYFELNNKILENFDDLMTKHLDQIKHLKISKNIKNNKFYNILNLCFNMNTLEIDSDIKLDTNRVFLNICKPELIEKIIFKDAKLPTGKVLEKFTDVKNIEMRNIKFSKVIDFFEQLNSKEKIEQLYFEDVDFMNNNLEFLKGFKNLKKLEMKNMINFKLENVEALLENEKLEEVKFCGNKIQFSQIRNLVNLKCNKDIKLQLESSCAFRNYIDIQDTQVNIKINVEDLRLLIKNINFMKITNLEIIFNEKTNFEEFAKIVKKVKNEINICITDISKLTVNQAKILKEKLKVNKICLIDENDNIITTYTIDDFINMRQTLDAFIKKVPEEESEQIKFLWIYKILLQNIKYDKDLEEDSADNLKEGLIDNKCISKGYADILRSCLLCMNIKANIVNGIIKKENEPWYWVQVLINNLWYNADIALDAKQNAKMKYCLISNEKISKTHNINTKTMYCVNNFEYKKVLQFWKNDTITKEKINIINQIVTRLKALFMMHKRLPEPDKGKRFK